MKLATLANDQPDGELVVVSADGKRCLKPDIVATLQRAIEMVDDGSPRTPFMSFGDTVFMEARTPEGEVVFGAIDQRVVQA